MDRFVVGTGGVDEVDLSRLIGIRSFGDVMSRTTQVGANTVINFGNGDTLTLQNVAKTSLTAGDFLDLDILPMPFLVNGRPVVLWEHDSGQVHIWTLDGLNRTGGVNVGPLPGEPWHLRTSADFNGDAE